MTTMTVRQGPGPFWKRFTPLFGAGLLGVAAITAASASGLSERLAALPNAPQLPAAALVAISVAQSALLLGVAVAAGAALAPGLGLRSRVAERATQGTPILEGLRPELPLALTAGALSGVLVVAFDLVSRPWMPPLKAGAEQMVRTLSHTNLPSVLGALLYGGITEELLMRWGIMTLLAWIGWRLVQRGSGAVRPAIIWTAIGVTSLLFGLGHLPATTALYPLTTMVVSRALLLNGLGGLIFGWLYWRRSLEAAMSAHMMAHVVLTVANLAAVTLVK